MTSTGRIIPPSKMKGVPVQDLCDLGGGLQPGMGVRIVAEDGYAMTISYDQIANGDFTAYDPGTGKETSTDDPLHVVAYEREGQPLSEKEDGTFRLALLNDDQGQVTDGHWWVKWVRQVAIVSLAQDWTLHLEGAITEDMDRNTFESGAAPNCHQATWTDDHAQNWVGIPLWLLVGRVDNEDQHGDEAFDRELADAGYTVDVVAADGYTASFESQRIKENDDIIVAYLVNDNPLDEEDFPLRLVGSDLQRSEMVGQITQIVVRLPEAVPTPEPTPEPALEPQAPMGDGALTITGAVEQSLSWTMQDLQGIRLNMLLDMAQPKAGAKSVVLLAGDGYTAELSLTDIQACADCLVAFADDGQLDAVMPGFESAFWVKDVVQIEVE
jgi:hypothetical protein